MAAASWKGSTAPYVADAAITAAKTAIASAVTTAGRAILYPKERTNIKVVSQAFGDSLGFSVIAATRRMPEQAPKPDFHGCRVVLDYRESGLSELLPGADSKPLPVGDVLVFAGGSPRLLLERKTAADLAASIVDGRWKEQTSRLQDAALGGTLGCGTLGCGTLGCGTLGCGTLGETVDGTLGCGTPETATEGSEDRAISGQLKHPLVVGVIVEGLALDGSESGRFRGVGAITGPALANALLSSSVRKGLIVLYSRDLEDTAAVVCRACRALSRPSKTAARRYIETQAPVVRLPGLARTARGGKCDAAAAGAAMLTVVPGVSAAIAEAVMDGHKSISALIDFLTRAGSEERVAHLAGIRHGCSRRRVGGAVAKRILEHLIA
jgi:ERCC4-type nuclease